MLISATELLDGGNAEVLFLDFLRAKRYQSGRLRPKYRGASVQDPETAATTWVVKTRSILPYLMTDI